MTKTIILEVNSDYLEGKAEEGQGLKIKPLLCRTFSHKSRTE